MESLNNRKQLPKCPRENASFLSYLTFFWIWPIFKKGQSKTLGTDDLYQPLENQKADLLGCKLEESWKKRPDLKSCFIDVFGSTILKQGLILLVLECGMKILPPIFLSRIISFYSNRSEGSRAEAAWWSAGIILSVLVNVLVLHAFNLTNLNCGFTMKTGSCSMIYRKCLKLSKTALGTISTGKIVNLMSNDVSK